MNGESMKEKLSALMDGELDPHEVEEVLALLRQDKTLLHDWLSWQAGGDILKGDGVAQVGFLARFSQRLDAEPVIVVPSANRHRGGSLRRLAMPATMVASVAFVGIAMWRYYGEQAEPVSSSQIAVETEIILHDYLTAHRQSEGNPFVDHGALQAQFQVTGQR